MAACAVARAVRAPLLRPPGKGWPWAWANCPEVCRPRAVPNPLAIPRSPGFLQRKPSFFLDSQPGEEPYRAMGRATERSPVVRLWITLGTFLAQPGSYPHKTPPPKSCCRRAPHFAHAAPHTLQRRKCVPALKKKRLSTKTGVLYYYCYLYIKPLKNNQNPKPGHLSTADGQAFGRLDRLPARPSSAKWGKAAA